jgi:CubicO group peptidase (beta-lactamase class C family)
MRRDAATGYIRRWDPMRLALRVLLPDVARQLYAGRVGDLMELREFTLDTAAIGGLVGSVTEFTRFLQMQLSEGAGVLTPASTRLMQTMVAEGAAGIESRVGVGLGWKIGRVGGRTFLNHEGGGAGFTSELRLYPEAGIGVALAMNTMRMPHTMRAAHRLCEAVFEARLGLL